MSAPEPPARRQRCLVVVPIRSFRTSKTRLGDTLDTEQRASLMQSLAEGVIGTLRGIDTVVVTSDEEVANWARSLDVEVLDPRAGGLDHAASAGLARAGELGFSRAAIVHADLASPASLPAALTGRNDVDVVVLADHHGTGTNVLVVPANCGFEFAYGPDSFARHCAEAERLGLSVLRITDDPLGRDIDTPEDLAWWRRADG